MYRNSYRILRFYNKSFTFHPKSHTQNPSMLSAHLCDTEAVPLLEETLEREAALSEEKLEEPLDDESEEKSEENSSPGGQP